MPASDLPLIAQAAREAGRIARHYHGLSYERWEKDGGAGPVTEADLEIDRMLRATLCAARPDYGWLSEETEDDPARLETRHCFIVDPIDGTRSFIEGGRDWGHSIAVVDGGHVVAGAVYMPLHDALYTASLDGGAYRNGERLSIRPCTGCAKAEMLASKAHLAAEYWANGTPPPVDRVFRSSLAYRLGLVARGRFDGMLSLRPTWEWDVAAGCLMVTEAGGVCYDTHGQPPRFNQPSPRLAGLVAGDDPLCQEVLGALARPCDA